MGEVSANLQRFIDKGFPDAMRKGMLQAVTMVQESATDKAPSDTGNLKRSIDFEVEEDGSEGVVFSNCEYAHGATTVPTDGLLQRATLPSHF